MNVLLSLFYCVNCLSSFNKLQTRFPKEPGVGSPFVLLGEVCFKIGAVTRISRDQDNNHSYTHTRSSEELRDGNVDNVNVTPPNVVPRLPRVSTGLGRGALLSSMLEHDMIATPVDSPSIKNTSLSGIRCDTPAFRGENHGFVQSDQPNQWQTMADLMKPLDSEIGNQIAASLSSAGQNVQRDHLSAQHPSTQPPDWSNLNLVIRH